MRGNQTIIKNTIHKVLDETDDFYICQSKKFILKEDYEVGEGLNTLKCIVVEWLDRMITSDNCYTICKEELMRKLNKIINL